MDEIHRIILETVNKEKVDALNQSLREEKDRLQELATAFRQGTINAQQFEAQAVVVGTKIVDLNSKMSTFGNISRETQMRVLELGRAAQDFAQGGFAGIINNIERLVGGAGPAAGILTLLGTALFVTKDYWIEWYNAMAGGKQKIPDTADAVDRLTDSIKKDGDAIKELRKQQDLNAIDMDKYIKLVDRVKRSEKELDDERQLRKMKEAPTRAEQKRGAQFREAMEEFGGVERLMEAIQASGLGPERAREMVLGAGRGEFMEVENIRRTVAEMGRLLQLDPRRMVALEANLKRERATAKRLADEVEDQRKAEQDQTEDARRMERDFGEWQAQTGKADLARLHRDDKAREDQWRKRFQALTPGAGELRKGDEELWMREAVRLQRQAQQQGGYTPAIFQRLERLREKLGHDFPTMEAVQMMQGQAQAGLVTNQASMHQRLRIAEETLRRIHHVGTESNRQHHRNLNGGGTQ